MTLRIVLYMLCIWFTLRFLKDHDDLVAVNYFLASANIITAFSLAKVIGVSPFRNLVCMIKSH